MRLRSTMLLAFMFCAAASQAAAVSVKPVTAPGLKAALAVHRGHVVVLNFWATWCDGCVEEFPDLVAVSKSLKTRGVDLVTVSADTRKDLSAKVIPFLKKHGVTGTHYLQSPGDLDTFAIAFDPRWQPAAYPRTYLYDKHGKRVRTLEGTLTRESLTAALKPLLK